MKLSTERRAQLADLGLLVLRVAAGLMLALGHGLPKAGRLLSGGGRTFADPLHVGATTSLVLTVFGELVCPLVVALGLQARLAAFPPFFTMAVASILVHANAAWSERELAVIYGLPFLVLMLTGAGRYSLDGRRARG